MLTQIYQFEDDFGNPIYAATDVNGIFVNGQSGVESQPTPGSMKLVSSNGIYTAILSKADKVKGASEGDIATLDATGNLVDSGKNISDLDDMVSITWSSLKSLRDNSSLVPGRLYRITDYVTTTTQENTQSAGHVFDIIVRADSESVLSENASAALHSGDTYFSGCSVNAWELKYCIDNDTDRFKWADTTNGKGVVYWMKDEWNNECPYDFKNIQFKRWAATVSQDYSQLSDFSGQYVLSLLYDGETGAFNNEIFSIADDSDYVWRYTFHCLVDDETDCDATLVTNNEGDSICIGNVIKEAHGHFEEDYYYKKIFLNDIVFYNEYISGEGSNVCIGNYIHYGCFNNTFLKSCFYNELGGYCYYNTFGNDCGNNTFGNSCGNNTFGNGCNSNTFGNYFTNNTFGNSCYSNTFGNNNYNNTFGNDCYSNTFGNNNYNNTFRNYFQNNTFGNGCNNNTFGNYCYSNSFGSDCGNNTFGNSCGSNTFGNGCYNNTFGNYFQNNTFGNSCNDNTFGNDYIQQCAFGDGVQYCSINKSYFYNNIIENGNQYITITSTQTTSSSNVLRNIKIAQGVNNTNTMKTISHNTVNDTFQTVYQPVNSQTISV